MSTRIRGLVAGAVAVALLTTLAASPSSAEVRVGVAVGVPGVALMAGAPLVVAPPRPYFYGGYPYPVYAAPGVAIGYRWGGYVRYGHPYGWHRGWR